MSEDTFADMLNTVCDAITSSVAFIYEDLVLAGILTQKQAAERMFKYADHMASDRHHSLQVGENVALKARQLASLLEKAGTDPS